MSKQKKSTRYISFKPYPSALSGLFKSKSLSSIPENSILTGISLPTNMSNPPIEQTPLNTIPNFPSFESLRIPEAIKDLPTYEGNPRLLNEFINNVEEILLHIKAYDATPQGQILLRAIRNKIVGQANEVLTICTGLPLIGMT